MLLTGLVTLGLLSRKLGVADFGVFAVAVMIAGWISISVTVATFSATVRLVAGHAEGSRYAASMLRTLFVLGVLLGGGLFLFAGLLADLLDSPRLALPLRILAVDVFLSMPLAAYGGILVARAHFWKNVTSMLAGALGNLVLAAVLIRAGWGVAGACFAVVGGTALHFVLGGVFTKLWPWGAGGVPLGDLWKQIRWLAASNLALRISQSMDLLALKIFAPSAVAVGLYAGAQNLSIGAMLAFLPVGGVALQAISSARKAGDEARANATADIFLRATLCFSALLAASSVLAPDFARLFLGKTFVDAGPLLAILLWAVSFRVLALAGRNFIAAVGESVSLLVPLLGLIATGAIAFALLVPAGGAEATAWIAMLLAAGGGVMSLREGLKLLDRPFPISTALRVGVAAGAGASAAGLVPGSAAWIVFPKAAVLLGGFATVLFLLGEWRKA